MKSGSHLFKATAAWKRRKCSMCLLHGDYIGQVEAINIDLIKKMKKLGCFWGCLALGDPLKFNWFCLFCLLCLNTYSKIFRKLEMFKLLLEGIQNCSAAGL